MAWFQENTASILVGLVLLALVLGIVLRMLKDRRTGKSGCGCGCEGCANHAFCHPPKQS